VSAHRVQPVVVGQPLVQPVQRAQTGERAVHLADRDRPAPGMVTALLRTLPLLVTAGLVAFFGRDGRGLHDVLAGSAVVRT
jgi:uncharacterized RDD family membrane protein YckC